VEGEEEMAGALALGRGVQSGEQARDAQSRRQAATEERAAAEEGEEGHGEGEEGVEEAAAAAAEQQAAAAATAALAEHATLNFQPVQSERVRAKQQLTQQLPELSHPVKDLWPEDPLPKGYAIASRKTGKCTGHLLF
jgi:hypothetical protein